MKRRPLIAGNWKMHTTTAEARDLATAIAGTCVGVDDRDVLLSPPYTVLRDVAECVGRTGIIVAAQNVCWEEKGAYTGEISPVMVRAAGGSAAIVGHSERRQIFLENDEMVNRRLTGALAFGLTVILCIGETLAERESGDTFAVLERQIRKGLAGVGGEAMAGVVIAYEPVWAIGTGKTASKEQAQEAHAFIRGLLAAIYEKDIAEQTRILYGGSVKPANIDEIMAQPDIDGALVGGAALDAQSFGRIITFR
ncbi:triose-phosphate isomerase [Desulfoprunum benzoelyticum]|uniref:Triosephosphate isomerase n=1 Tax=Desulfoprunum benzoelyticum TaxID=1506996 RepID=A0A840UT03_9BACT|nr:triose-phosphate isomerase [Desulfoprunum benzoelyticum]MBB5347883.1 triosephosphate isomerase [Desulfoprunum benzoelyticum]MBM9530360.1 triose-phosphate isomerase [Desulfoprunum benzoelyticum]